MADVITRLKVDSQEYDAKIKRATQSLNEMTTAAEREGNKIATANKENIALAQSLGKMATVSTTAKGKMAELTSAIEAATIQYNRLTAAEKQGQFGRALNASIGQLQTRLAGLKTEMAAVQGQMGKTSGMGLGAQFGQGLKSGMMMFGPQMAAMAGVMAAAAGVKKVFSDMININKDFEQSWANLSAVMGKTRDETNALATQAKQLGATTQYTAIQILDLQTNLARLGFTQQEILNSTKAVQALATATQADLGEAANLAGSALRGFGLDATEMDRVASVLAVSTTKSALSFEKLATAMPIVSPVAKQFGFTIEDTVTLLGKLSDAGMDASMAATATRNIFLRMANDSGKLAKAMGRPVHSVEEFGEALKDMKEKGMSLNDILQMVGVRGTAAFAVFADNADKLKGFKESITDCSGELDKMVSEQLNTLHGSALIMKSAWEGLMLTFSESNGILRKVTDALARLLQAWANWRNRNAGGEAAINTYTNDMTEKDKQGARDKIDAMLKKGSNAENIVAGTTKRIEQLKKEEVEMQKLADLYKKYNDLGASDGRQKEKLLEQISSKQKALFKDYSLQKDGNAEQYLYRKIAENRDKQQRQQYNLDYVQSKISTTEDASGNGSGLGGDGITAKRKASIEAEAKAEIAALDKVQMIKEGKEEEYEDRVYAIRKSALEQIAQLYAEDTKEYAQVQAQKSQLDIQYQNTKLRLLKKTESEQKKAEKAAAKQDLSFSTTGISNLGNQIRQRVSGAGIGTKEYKDAAAQMVDFQSFQNLLQTAIKNGLDIDSEWLNSLFEDVKIGMDVDDSTWQALVDDINAKLSELDLPPIELDVKTGNVKALDKQIGSLEQNLEGAINVFGQLGQAMQEIDDPGAKVAGIIMGAIANIAGTFAASLKGTFTPWDWIAAAISGTATMISTIAAIKSATSGSYASGGIIPGNSYSGDNLTANVNSGELILNKAQQGSIASQLSNNNPMQNLQLSTEISGTNLRIVMNNDNRSKGGSRGFYSNIH